MLDLWLKILDIMDRLMNSGQGDNLEEAVPESLKNILLVMADGGFIRPPVKGEQPTELWKQTVKRVDRFLPDLVKEIFPQADAQESGVAPPASEEDTTEKPFEEQRPPAEQPPAQQTEGENDDAS